MPLLDFELGSECFELTFTGAWLHAERKLKDIVNKDKIFIINGMMGSNN